MMKTIHTIAYMLSVLLLMVIGPVSSVQAQLGTIIKDDEMDSIVEMAARIQEICPPTECVILALGRSPTPVSTFLKLEKENYVWDLPLSDFRYGANPTSKKLDQQKKDKLFAHFDRFFPKPDDLKGRKVLLLDFSLSGESLASASAHLKEYLGQKSTGAAAKNSFSDSVRPSIISVALVPAGNRPNEGLRIEHLLEVQEGRLLDALFDSAYDKWAPYGKFNILYDELELDLRNPKHQQFLLEMKLKRELHLQKSVKKDLVQEIDCGMNESQISKRPSMPVELFGPLIKL